MRNILFSLLFVFLTTSFSVFGQNNELNFWNKNAEFGTSSLWYLYYGDKIFVDARYGYDDLKTGEFGLGKKFGSDTFAVVPKFCGYYGRTKGYGPELLAYSETEHIQMFSQTQYLHGTGNKSFFYNFTVVNVVVAKHVAIGAAGQVFKEIKGSPTTADIGPSLQITFGKVALRVWPNWAVDKASRGRNSIWMGVGYAW